MCLIPICMYALVLYVSYLRAPVGTDQERLLEVMRAWSVIRFSHHRETLYIDSVFESMHLDIRVGDKVTVAQAIHFGGSTFSWIKDAMEWITPPSALAIIT